MAQPMRGSPIFPILLWWQRCPRMRVCGRLPPSLSRPPCSPSMELRRLKSYIDESFLSRPVSQAQEAPVSSSTTIWDLGDAFARIRHCCTSNDCSDQHANERRGLTFEMEDLKRRRSVAAQLLDEVEQEVTEIQRCLQERIQRLLQLGGPGHNGNRQ